MRSSTYTSLGYLKCFGDAANPELFCGIPVTTRPTYGSLAASYPKLRSWKPPKAQPQRKHTLTIKGLTVFPLLA
ncbi:hypothetical protein PI125_g12880 [Phytophthora idaei]|nr:hypothetical protein PI125_g12880 [Phytophthora idaei]